MRKAKIGILVDSLTLTPYQQTFIEMAQDSQSYDIDCYIIQKIPDSKPKFNKLLKLLHQKNAKKTIARALFWVITKIESSFFKRHIQKRYGNKPSKLNLLKVELIWIEPLISKSGFIYRYSEKDIAKIQGRELDLLIRFGSGILRGEVLHSSRYGILSFHHADNDYNRGGPPGFWEVYNRNPKTGFILQLLNEELDGGDVIFKGNINTLPTYIMNRHKLYSKSSVFLHYNVERLLEQKGKLPVYPKQPYSDRLFTTPTVSVQLSYLFFTTLFALTLLLKKTMRRTDKWSVAYQFCENWRDVALHKSRIVKNPLNRFFADPFIVQRGGRNFCFVEDYDFSERKGKISVLELSPNGEEYLGIALEDDFHLSYPFVFECDGDLFMCPETHARKDIRLYRCREFPLKWELEIILMNNVDAADTSIFKKDGKWWMFTNLCSARIGDHNSELHIFSSTDLLKGHWTPHPMNPVIFDAERGRNGGLILQKKAIYRVFQKHGWGVYGESCGVAKITNLTEQHYNEETQFLLQPQFFRGVRGIHTFNQQNGIVVFDFLKSMK